uniref:RPA-interacting protein C-terminal domain-containing protein n=2 Tax=Vespula pensylvanica TaxID=30213 RepID=A0A834P6V4_VESPE|nr:hypothetical protein H0235_006519 [Vespula pensylvanica]
MRIILIQEQGSSILQISPKILDTSSSLADSYVLNINVRYRAMSSQRHKSRLKVMENTGLSPLLIAKLKIKDVISKMKNKSPQLQEVLRQRCRRRMKERRKEIFNARRLGLGDISEKSEESFQLDEETNEEEENWICEEYERMLQDEIEWIESLVYDDRKIVICPVCQTDTMVEISESVYCKVCGFWPTNCNDIETLGNLIDNSVDNHSQRCTAVPGFTMVSENNSSVLYMTCEECSFLTCVI